MITKIYYFSGVGNSLALAKMLKSNLGMDTELIRITEYKSVDSIEINAETFGIVFPVYFHSIPAIVRNFMKKIKIKGNPYIFAVAACNAVPGHSLFTIERLLMKKGYKLSAGYKVDMPGVSVVDGFLTSEDINVKRIEDSKAKILEIANEINRKVLNKPEGINSLMSHITGSIMTTIAGKMMNPALFYTTNQCSNCGVCKRICPMENIEMSKDQKPIWGKECLHCMACLHLCPHKAVELGKHSQEKVRFRHPEISLDEMLNAGT